MLMKRTLLHILRLVLLLLLPTSLHSESVHDAFNIRLDHILSQDHRRHPPQARRKLVPPLYSPTPIQLFLGRIYHSSRLQDVPFRACRRLSFFTLFIQPLHIIGRASRDRAPHGLRSLCIQHGDLRMGEDHTTT